MALPRSSGVLAGAFIGSGVVHLVRPQTFESMMPRWLPRHRELIYASGVAELACAAGMVHPRTRPIAGWASAALLAAIFPANVQMARDALARDDLRHQAVTVGRLPLQVPMIWAAIRAAWS